jgi:Uncharacterized conserved protein (DUF2278)
VPLAEYGVLLGKLDHFTRDDPNNFGSWFHGKIYVRAPLGVYECAVDVSHPEGVRVQYRVVELSPQLFANVRALADGYHLLASTSSSGAIDYVRSELFRVRLGCMFAPFQWLARLLQRLLEGLIELRSWKISNGNNALDILESNLASSRRVFAFGAPYRQGLGMHDIHMNQGDPPGPFQALDGIWQDGGTIIERANGSLVAFLVKFETQTLNTNDQGLPA